MRRAFLIWLLCSHEIHDVGLAREGVCQRCHLRIGPDGNAVNMSTTNTLLPIGLFTNWLAAGERGLSSEAIVANLTGQRIGLYSRNTDYPHDPSDYRRCQVLLEQHPLARLTFPSMGSVSPQWARLVEAWDEIHRTLEAECPGYLTASRHSGRTAPRTYKLMQRVIAGGEVCATCTGTGHASECPKCHGTGRRSGGRCRAEGCYGGHLDCADCRGRGYTGGTR